MDLKSVLAKIPGFTAATNQVDAIRAAFLAIPAQTRTNKETLARVRGLTNDANEAAAIVALQSQAAAVDSGFASVLGQFQHFDDLKRAGAGTAELVTAGATLATSAQSVKRASDALTAKVAPLAAKYGQASPVVGGGSSAAGMLMLAAAGVGLFLLLSPRRKQSRRSW